MRARLYALIAAGLIGALVACGGTSKTGASSTPSSSAAPPPASASASPGPSSQPPPAGVVLDLTIANGQVTPTNAVLQAKVGQPIIVRVTSDATDELHVHSVPDKEFEIAPAPNQTFQFTVDVPGDVDVELHHLDRTVATLQVRP
jgi:hypothetical protein